MEAPGGKPKRIIVPHIGQAVETTHNSEAGTTVGGQSGDLFTWRAQPREDKCDRVPVFCAAPIPGKSASDARTSGRKYLIPLQAN